MIPRRHFLKILGGSAVALSTGSVFANPKTDFPIGACDWTLGKRGDIAVFDLAAKIGLEGVQVTFGPPGDLLDLRDKKVREQYYKRSDETGVRLASLGMGVLNKMPLATHPEAINWVADAIDVLAAMQKERPGQAPTVCLLAFFGKGDINGKPELMDSVIKKLRTVSRQAEEHGVVFGIESLLSADDHLKLIDGVGSKAIQVYYDSANSDRMGYNIYDEVVQIGGHRICEVHCKEDRELIGKGKIDFPRFKKSLDTAGYKGWLIIEGSKPKKADIVEAYQQNFKKIDQVFRGAKG